jgi:hypothetical protein
MFQPMPPPRTPLRTPLILPPGHRAVITVDADQALLGVTIEVFRNGAWIGETSVTSLPVEVSVQELIDGMTQRGPRGSR